MDLFKNISSIKKVNYTMNKSISSTVFGIVNILIGLVPNLLLIPLIASKSGNEGVYEWNYFLALVAIHQIIIDYGTSHTAPNSIKLNKKNINKLVIFKIIVSFLLIGYGIFIFIIGNNDIGLVIVTSLVFSWLPTWYFQAKDDLKILCIFNIISLLLFLLIVFFYETIKIEVFLYLYFIRVLIYVSFSWTYILFYVKENIKIKYSLNNYYINFKLILRDNSQVFFKILSMALINSGYLLWIEKTVGIDDFALISVSYKLAMIGIMIVASYCNSMMLTFKNIKLPFILILIFGIIYWWTIQYFIEFLGLDITKGKSEDLSLFGLFFIIYGMYQINLYKLIHQGNKYINILSIIIYVYVSVVLCIGMAYEIQHNMVIIVPIILAILLFLASRIIMDKK